MIKLVRDGMVAVLYSPGFGAGWYTWNQECTELMFDPAIVKFVFMITLARSSGERQPPQGRHWHPAGLGG